MSKLSAKSKKQVSWGVDTKDAPYIKASELEEGEVYNLLGAFITPDNGYGLGGVLITEVSGEVTLVNTPASAVEIIKEILDDVEIQESIKAGNEGFKVRSYMNTKLKKAKKCFAIDFVEVSNN